MRDTRSPERSALLALIGLAAVVGCGVALYLWVDDVNSAGGSRVTRAGGFRLSLSDKATYRLALGGGVAGCILLGVAIPLTWRRLKDGLERQQYQQRLRDGCCGRCGYNLRGVNERCPECGEYYPRALPPEPEPVEPEPLTPDLIDPVPLEDQGGAPHLAGLRGVLRGVRKRLPRSVTNRPRR